MKSIKIAAFAVAITLFSCEKEIEKAPAQTEQATHRGAVPENRRRARSDCRCRG